MGEVVDLQAVDRHRVHLHILEEHQRQHQAEQQGPGN